MTGATPPAPTAEVATPVAGHEYAGPMTVSSILRKPSSDGLVKKLDRDPGFGQGLLLGIDRQGAPPEPVVGRMGDVMNAAKRAQLEAALGKLAARMKDDPDIRAKIGVHFGYGSTDPLENFAFDPTHYTGQFMGAIAVNDLPKRTQIANVTNRVNALLAELEAEARPSDKDRPAPSIAGTRGLEGKLVRADFRISGQRFRGEYRDTQLAEARALGLKVEVNGDKVLNKHKANGINEGITAGFNYKTGTIYIRSDATRIEWFHELTHAKQWLALGPEAYAKQSTFDRELHVFREINKNNVDFNSYELEAARNYIIRLAEAERVELPPDVFARAG